MSHVHPISCLVFVLALATSPAVCRAEFFDGNELYGRLVDYKRERTNNLVNASIGFGYVIGVVDAGNRTRNGIAGFRFCLPANVKSGQLVDITLGYLERNPDKRHFSGDSLIASAMSDVFPCNANP